MAQSFTVTGQKSFFDFAAKLRQAELVEYDRQLDRAVRRSAKHIEKAVRDEAPKYLPAGYETVFIASMVFTTSVKKTAGQRITIRLRAKGARGHDRQVDNIERGILRHPVFARGPRKNWTWVGQRVRPRFFTQPATKAAPQVRDEIQQAIHNIAQKIMEG